MGTFLSSNKHVASQKLSHETMTLVKHLEAALGVDKSINYQSQQTVIVWHQVINELED